MAKDKNTTPDTLEAALAVIENLNAELTASNEVAEALKVTVEELTVELEGINAKHAEEIDSIQSKVQSITKSVPGTYKSKVHNVTIKMKDGWLKTRVKDVVVDSKDLIKNKGGEYTEFLDNLIKIGYGGIEEVK